MTRPEDEARDDGPVSNRNDPETRTEGKASASGTSSDAGSKASVASVSASGGSPPARDAGSNKSERFFLMAVGAGAVVAALFIGRSCTTTELPSLGASAAPASGDAVDRAAAEVNAGLQAATPNEAVTHFRKALEHYPGHYGATFQLARALDRAGNKDEARKQWQAVLELAEKAGDEPLVNDARARLGMGTAPQGAQQGAAPQDAQAAAMAAGLDALYSRRDPAGAAARFREILQQNPDHYGATYQLATALDQLGHARGARPLWEKMAQMADAIQDATTADAARARLAELDKVLAAQAPEDPDAAAMKAGIEALYTKKDPTAAAAHFRKVLERNKDHYGATYQLATALDQMKRPAEARVYWERILKMAEAIQDTRTADAARARLAQKP